MAEYIEREAIEFPYMTMTLWGLNQSTCKAYNEGVKAAADAVAAVPTADVVPVVHGRWEHHENGTAYCSECEMDAVEDGTDYCPNCGAKMDLKGGEG